MNDKIFQEAEKLFERTEKIADRISEYEREQLAFRSRYERLKAERQAREVDQDRR
jgi:hypothetical protein